MDPRTADHVGIAVHSLDDAIPTWETLLAASSSGRERVESQQVEVVFIGEGPARVELLAPTHPESPVGRFLARRGEGIHHLAYRVPDLQAALDRLRSEGYQLVDEHPREGAHGHRIAFLHPRTLNGVLVELVEDPQPSASVIDEP